MPGYYYDTSTTAVNLSGYAAYNSQPLYFMVDNGTTLDTTAVTVHYYDYDSGTGTYQPWTYRWYQPWTYQPYYPPAAYQPFALPELTPAECRRAEVAARRRERAEVAAHRKRERERLTAQQKAERLLLQHLTPEQQDEYRRLEHFSVIGPDGRIYRINHGRSGNVQLIEETEDGIVAIERFCIHPVEQVPDEDTMLTQKLLIESDLATFRRIANITYLGRQRLVA